MADEEQVRLLRSGVEQWNAWRKSNFEISIDLSQADLREAYLRDADLSGANLSDADLSGANLRGANLSGADLLQADLLQADLSSANFSSANFSSADLSGADLRVANLSSADLTNAKLDYASLVETQLDRAILIGCTVYGISAWNVNLEGATQANLCISKADEPTITTDSLEVAQFLYLMLHNAKIRDIIDTITSKVVLILGRFTPERKQVLDAIREELRKRNYVPVLFDFEGPTSHNFTETVTLLARMARFIIADLTEPSSIPKELEAIVPHVHVPVQPLIAEGFSPFAMFPDYRLYPWMLKLYRYASLEELIASMGSNVIEPAEAKVIELRKLRLADDEGDS